MDTFHVLKVAVEKQFAAMVEINNKLFITDVAIDVLWNQYLDSFPEGTNPIYNKRREYDCQYCKSFIKRLGNVVSIKDGVMTSIWDIDAPHPFTDVVKTLARLVKVNTSIKDIYLSKELVVGIDKTHKDLSPGVQTWEHFYVRLPNAFINADNDSIASTKGQHRDSRNVFKRSMQELTLDAGSTILELIEQKSLYKGDEFRASIAEFIGVKVAFDTIPFDKRDNWCWEMYSSFSIARIRNTAIGTLLINISDGMELDEAVGKFEAVVAPTNYKRPKAIFTKRMVENAEKEITELGYVDSLGRRHAKLDDIKINNVLFLHRDSKKNGTSVFDKMKTEAPSLPKNLSKLEEISIDEFVSKIVPKAKSIQLMVENKHQGNLMSLIAPQDKTAPSMFQWNNNFSWSYNGDIADSMKQHVKAAGGKIDGVLRFSIQWNDQGDNNNDFDAHCREPKGNIISFSNMRNASTGGNLDVDITHPQTKVAVENITWPTKSKMQEGKYKFLVHNYSHRGGTSGFTAEIEYEGEVYSYSYDKELKFNEKVVVAELMFSKTDGIEFMKSLDSTYTQKELWGIKTNSFVEVSSMMRSPNYWETKDCKGNEHYFFFLNGCMTTSNPRGFYNEFLGPKLLKHKKVFEALGSKMRVEHNNDQLSGLGFSTTQRNSVIAKVEGTFNRMIKINF